MASFTPQLIPNAYFNGVRSYTYNDVTTFYDWDDNSCFGVNGFEQHVSGGVTIASGIGILYSSVIPITNSESVSYTLSGIMQYTDASVNGKVTIRELDEDLSTLSDTTWQPALTDSLAGYEYTIGGAVTNDLQLNSNTISLQILLNQTTQEYRIYSLELVGSTYTLGNTDLSLPASYEENLLQRSSYTAGGKALSDDSYSSPLKQLSMDYVISQKTDYDTMYSFLNSNDIKYTLGTFNYTDALGNTFFGKFLQDNTNIMGTQYYGASLNLTFMELPY